MSKFIVHASETVAYRVVVEAEDEDQAREMVENGDVDLGSPVDVSNFEIDAVAKSED